MAFKFPFTNYHELNLTWVLEQLKKLFEESEENVQTIETYDERLSAVESEVSTLETTTSQAINTANAAATNAATALSRANTANQNALTASSQAGAAVTAAQESQQEAQAATQAAQQAQATAMTFDGRITQAQNDASAAVHEAESFENRVNAAINTANNAANTATIAQGIAVNANQTAAQAMDELNAQRDELIEISEEQQEAIEEKGQQVIASIPSDYTQLSADVKNKAPVIVANASGDVVSIKDGADDMVIRHLLATINPIQAGTGEPSPSNVRPITGRTGLTGARTGKNLVQNTATTITNRNVTFTVNSDGTVTANGTASANTGVAINQSFTLPKGSYILSGCPESGSLGTYLLRLFTAQPALAVLVSDVGNGATFTLAKQTELWLSVVVTNGTTVTNKVFKPMIRAAETDETYEQYAPSQNISVSWASEAGTVYGGMLDVATGDLQVTKSMITIRSLTWTYESNYFFANIPSAYMGNNPAVPINAICSCYKTIAQNDVAASDEVIYGQSYLPTRILIKDTDYTDVQSFLSAVGDQVIVYKLATPQTYHLDPVTVKTLLGYNTIYTDCGPVSVDYPADTKLYIDGKFTELQALILEN